MPTSLRAEARFIAVLREPASRMLSWYNHRVADAQRGAKYAVFCALAEDADLLGPNHSHVARSDTGSEFAEIHLLVHPGLDAGGNFAPSFARERT